MPSLGIVNSRDTANERVIRSRRTTLSASGRPRGRVSAMSEEIADAASSTPRHVLSRFDAALPIRPMLRLDSAEA